MTPALRRIDHPGQPARARDCALVCHACPVTLTLRAGESVTQAITDALAQAGIHAAYLRLDGATLDPLRFVIPAPAPGDGHAAWYSRTHAPARPVRLLQAGVHAGWRDDARFLHCHGLWDGAAPAMGHALCPESILAAEYQATGWAIEGAGLYVEYDPETEFSLFQPHSVPSATAANAVLATLRPNQDIGQGLRRIAARHGMQNASIHGIGSLVGTCFQDGSNLDSYATEILIRDGRVQAGNVALDVASVGFDGRVHAGKLTLDANAICVTAEVLLIAE
ncbi:hypothetical protein [Roseinatronobacter alkalisoli]|uniref:DUF296 domain-containing protein n=1 Tax=Roseinatronobacter alkalisoli TaxID=3028235 RepID=A0ABT5TA27_9RHOB|nr:hypothetical protein [Roseinatronobacter sp. HJB301]MDD7971042.1 hypothetical protein [Roseinatronobacter sp. HJB301]